MFGLLERYGYWIFQQERAHLFTLGQAKVCEWDEIIVH